jgi:8-oxo-dGTP pyrophosphatase MutT (NUDIX family)
MKRIPRLIYAIGKLRWRITRPVTLGVRLLLIKDQSVLLVKHTYQPHWYLVGGGVSRGETLEQAARREAAEEVGAMLGALHLHGVYTNFFDYKSDHVVVFVCTDFTLASRPNREIETSRFFAFDDLPPTIAAGHKRRIREYVQGDHLPGVGNW